MIAVLALAGTLLSSSLVAFGFARLRFPGRRVLFILLLSTMMLPDVVTLVPQFVLFRSIGWVDTFLPLIVPSFLGGGAFNIFLVRQFYLTIPRDFDEAARLDGASNLRIWWHIILPLSRPVLVAVGIFSFVYHWNDFLLPLIYLQSEGNKTLALGLRAFISPTDASWNISMAASMFLVIPVLIVFFVAQRQFIRGVVMTGIQGR
jgi:multiple sugar transport system permease protein